ncbi:MAG: glutamate mutase L [Armatimonadetes bacterium]|nr:glutamate mutase L [Armatimonadota bacterium]
MAQDIRRIIATDCGSTTTKAILIEKNEEGEYRLVARGEAPTTVERPFEDVTVGVLNSVRELEEITEAKLQAKRTLLKDGRVWRLLKDGQIVDRRNDPHEASDLYLSTSSAGGGLQMMVAGVVKAMSAESAERAALGAGAILMDTLAVDDGRKEYQKVDLLRQLRPDIILMSGGTDGGTVDHLVQIAEIVKRADPKPRFGDMQLPVIYAGNKEARDDVKAEIGGNIDLQIVDNIRPTLDRENLMPAREAIHELFLEHVMQQAPGYGKLLEWVSEEIMATPNAVGRLMESYAKSRKINLLGVDIGGATTDTFSVFSGVYNRTVSANLGLSYSICNVLKETGVNNIKRWLPFDIESFELRNRLRNKMIRPTTIPQTYEDLLIEHGVAREALRLALAHHKTLARGLKGVQIQRTVGEALVQEASGQTLVKLMDLDMIIGSGGVLSHAPDRKQCALMLIDAYQPEGVTMLTVDSIFMMPHLGVLSEHHPDAADEVFERDCLIRIGTCVAPTGLGKPGEPCLKITGDGINEEIPFGEIRLIPSELGEVREVTLEPSRGFDVGAGKSRRRTAKVEGGVAGVIIDCRGRPFELPDDDAARVVHLKDTLESFGLPLP